MNKAILMGRLTRDPDIRYTQGAEQKVYGRYTLAVDRPTKNKQTDFISCVCFGKTAEFAEKYLHKGDKITVCGSIQTGSYTDREGRKVYTTDVLVNEHYFCESKGNSTETNVAQQPDQQPDENGFMQVPDGMDDLPFD